MNKGPTVNIIGAGIIGMSCAYTLRRGGAEVRIFDPNRPGRAASWAAAGMLSPAYEAIDRDVTDAYLELCVRAKSQWAGFVKDLEAKTALDLGYCPGSSLAVAATADEIDGLNRLTDRLESAAIAYRWLSPVEAHMREPSLASNVLAVLELPSDGWVNNRLVVQALAKLMHDDFHPYADVSERPFADFELQAAWMASPKSDHTLFDTGFELPETTVSLRSVAGRMHVYDRDALPVNRVIRCGDEYAVPRDTETLFGATIGKVEDADAYLETSAGRFLTVEQDCCRTGLWDGFRPRFSDHRLRMGAIDSETFMAMGHYRNGILLAPLTGEILAEQILSGKTPGYATPFLP